MHALHLASPNTNTVKSPHLDFIWIQSQQQNIQKEVWFVVVRLIEPTHCCMPYKCTLVTSASDQDSQSWINSKFSF